MRGLAPHAHPLAGSLGAIFRVTDATDLDGHGLTMALPIASPPSDRRCEPEPFDRSKGLGRQKPSNPMRSSAHLARSFPRDPAAALACGPSPPSQCSADEFNSPVDLIGVCIATKAKAHRSLRVVGAQTKCHEHVGGFGSSRRACGSGRSSQVGLHARWRPGAWCRRWGGGVVRREARGPTGEQRRTAFSPGRPQRRRGGERSWSESRLARVAKTKRNQESEP
jgi:hypothetical protein